MNPYSRRQFLKTLGWGAGAAAVAPTTLASLLAQAGPVGAQVAGERVLVLVQLGGGNDGLDTVVPISGPNGSAYTAARGALARSGDRLLPLDADFALASELPGLRQWWEQGRLAVVHGVHHERDDLSHFSNFAVVWAGVSDPVSSTGWVGRTVDRLAPGSSDPTLLALSLDGAIPILAGAEVSGSSVTADRNRVFGVPGAPADPTVMASYRALSDPAAGDPPLDASARAAQTGALHVGETVGPYLPEGGDDSLASQLATVATLIAAGLPTRIYVVTHEGDFDVHANQGNRQPALLSTLDAAVTGFFDQLGGAAGRVVLATYSEFGRRVGFNGSGTDHGAANVWFVMGPAVQGGHHGAAPSLTDLDSHGNLRPTTSQQSVNATLVGSWLGVDPAGVFGGGVPLLGLL